MKLAETKSEGCVFDGSATHCQFDTMRVLRRLFVLPKNPSVVWRSLHDRVSANRVALKVVSLDDPGSEYPALKIPGRAAMFDDERLDTVLEPYFGKTVYLQVEYEE